MKPWRDSGANDMRRGLFVVSFFLSAVCALFSAAALQAAVPGADNIVKNGSFEEKDKENPRQPAHWQRLDGLCTFWVKDPLRKGRCLKIDTDVYKEEYLARQKELKQKPVPPARPKTPTSGSKYTTIAGVDGVPFYSDWITVKPGQFYRLTVESKTGKGKKTPKVFIKGYFLDPRRPKHYQRRVMYKKYLDCPATQSKWAKHETVFCPTVDSEKVQWMRIMIYGYWPPGVYYFDNVQLVPASASDAKRSKRK